MHLEAWGLYDLSPIQLLSLQRAEGKTMLYKQDPQSAVYPAHVFSERNCHGGFNGWVFAPRFQDFPCIVFAMPPIRFSTHQMDDTFEGWRLTFKQKAECSRVRVTVKNNDDFGFRVRLPAGKYETVEDVFLMIQKQYVVEESEHGVLKTVPKTIEKIIRVPVAAPMLPPSLLERDVFEQLAEHNNRKLAALGDWRPGKPSRENVVEFQDYVDQIERAVPKESFDIMQAIENIA